MWKEYYDALVKRVNDHYEVIYEGVKMKVYGNIRKAMICITQGDPWKLWHDRKIIGESFYVEVLN